MSNGMTHSSRNSLSSGSIWTSFRLANGTSFACDDVGCCASASICSTPSLMCGQIAPLRPASGDPGATVRAVRHHSSFLRFRFEHDGHTHLRKTVNQLRYAPADPSLPLGKCRPQLF